MSLAHTIFLWPQGSLPSLRICRDTSQMDRGDATCPQGCPHPPRLFTVSNVSFAQLNVGFYTRRQTFTLTNRSKVHTRCCPQGGSGWGRADGSFCPRPGPAHSTRWPFRRDIQTKGHDVNCRREERHRSGMQRAQCGFFCRRTGNGRGGVAPEEKELKSAASPAVLPPPRNLSGLPAGRGNQIKTKETQLMGMVSGAQLQDGGALIIQPPFP